MKGYYCLLLAAALGAGACASSRGLALGNYRETRGPGVVMWTSHSLRLLPGQTFEYGMSSDDIESGKNGAGTYQLHHRQLELVFNGKPLVQATYARLRSLPPADSLHLTFAVQLADLENTWQPASGATVLLRDPQGQVRASAATDTAGRAVLRLSRPEPLGTLSVSYIGYQPLQQPVPAASTAFQVYLQPSLGRLYEAGSVLRFRVRRHTATRLVLGQGREKLTLLKTP